MLRKLIALAIAGLSGAAFAQSNVTIYGTLDGSWEAVSASGATTPGAGAIANNNSYASRTRIATNSSLIGFKGTEALGNGLAVAWQVENQLSLDGPAATTNTQSMANGWNTRDTYVGLAGGFGTFAVGYLSTPQRATAAKFDVMPGATGPASSLNTIGRVNTGAVYNAIAGGQNNFGTNFSAATSGVLAGNQAAANTAIGAQAQNIGTIFRTQGIAYISPTVGGFNAVLAYVPNENRDNAALNATSVQKNPSGWNVSFNYDNGPLAASVAYLKLNDIGALNGGPSGAFTGAESHKNWLLGASYAFAPETKLFFMYDNFKGALGLTAAAGGGDETIKRNAWYLGFYQGFGNSEIRAYYSRVGDNSVGGAVTAAAGRSFGDDGASGFGLRYAYNFSKRSQVYAIYTRITNKTNGNYDFSAIDPALGAGTGGGNGVINAGADPQVLGVGIRHNF